MNNNSQNINIAIVGNAPEGKHEYLNEILSDENITDICDITLYGEDGQPEEEAFNDAIADWKEGIIQAIVCLPMKANIVSMLGKATDSATNVIPLLVNNASRMMLTNTDLTTLNKQAKGEIAEENAETLPSEDSNKNEAEQQTELLTKIMKRDFSIQNPRIAFLYDNEVEATEPGTSSKEMSTVVFGPYCQQQFFAKNMYNFFDILMSNKSVECENNFRFAGNEQTVTFFSNIDIPLIQAEPEGIISSLFLVKDVVNNRKEYDAPFENPLPKLYHERREDGDKARFAVKKKGFNPAEHRRENIRFTTHKPAESTENPTQKE